MILMLAVPLETTYGIAKTTSRTELMGSEVAMVTYYKIQRNETHQVHFKKDDFQFVKYSLTNIAQYCQHHGMPFFFRNGHLVDTDARAAYWGKMDVISNYFKFGYKWIIWTDVDVLFFKKEQSLIKLWVEKAEVSGKHVALVKECNFRDKNRTDFGEVRSGFLAVKNSPIGQQFLKSWIDSFDRFKKNYNPDQDALEALVKEPEWKDLVHSAAPDGIHTYSSCQKSYDFNATSVHYPGPTKANIIKDAQKIGVLNSDDFYINMDL